MRYALVTLFACLLLHVSPAHATEVGTSRVFGMGVQIGEPTGIVGKAFLGGGTALDFGMGFAGWGWRGRCEGPDGRWHDCHNRREYFSVHLDYLWEETFFASLSDWTGTPA